MSFVDSPSRVDFADRRVVHLFSVANADGLGRGAVERINQFSFYDIGGRLKQLRVPSGDVNAASVFSPLFQARTVLAKLLLGEPIPLSISKQCAQQLADAVEFIWNNYYTELKDKERTFKFPEDGETIPAWMWSRIRDALDHFETVLAEEMREAATYFVPRRGIYWTPALVDTADETFPSDVRGYIPEKACEDWRASGRCLAFSLLTASGFHAARAVESMLEAYYQLFSGKPGKTLRSWDDYIKELTRIAERDSSPKPSAKTLSELDQMRTFDRNPIMHPRVVLSESDARILFGSSESLILAMAQEIAVVKKAGGIQTDLALVNADAASG